MKYGYARISTQTQTLDQQVDALKKYGCEQIVLEKKGALKNRPEFDALIERLSDGDTMVVWRLDRVGRSLGHLIRIVKGLGEKGVQFVSLTESIDTTTPIGKLFFYITGAFAEYERDLISERTIAKLEFLKKEQKLGQPFRFLPIVKRRKTYEKCRKYMGRATYFRAKKLIADHKRMNKPDFCREYGVPVKKHARVFDPVYEKQLRGFISKEDYLKNKRYKNDKDRAGK
jgi:DNA invertase Pin-like site-specific DNA recombinase